MPNDKFFTEELTGLAIYLVRDGLLDIDIAKAASKSANEQGMPLICYLVKAEFLSSQSILECGAKHFGLPTFDLKNIDPAWLHDPIIKTELIHRYHVIPLCRDQNTLHLAIADPTDHAAIAAISFHTGLHIRPMLVAEIDLHTIITTYYQTNILSSQLESALAKISPLEKHNVHDHIEQNDEPVSEFVDHLLHDAIAKLVSDIHIEPFAEYCRIRFRRDGLLYEVATLPLHLATRIMTRLKIMAQLDIAERRLPQDGRIPMRHQSKIDIRLNTCPTLFGEKLVLRILDIKQINLNIDLLGFADKQKNIFLKTISQPQGLILVTGPTGSGKTLTLYSALQHLNQIQKNISSVEDPVEIELYGVNQVNINPRIGLDFAAVLRNFLRQDPDIIMVGEIRDTDTAMIAMQAAQTGHLVLSTLHTNSAAETIVRLQSMGIAAYHLISSISLIIAQRLVRKLCEYCAEPEILPTEFKHVASKAVGCQHCLHGYKGRTGIFELVPITQKMANLILSQANPTEISDQARQEGALSLWDAGLEKVHKGITSYAELVRVVGS